MHQNFGLDQSSIGVAWHSVRDSGSHDGDGLGLLAQEFQLVLAVAVIELRYFFALQARVLLVDDFHGG
jgi:hypothetical protein